VGTGFCIKIKDQRINIAKNIQSLQIDSRKTVLNGAETLFIALVGSYRDGHHYVIEAYEKGIRHFLVSKEIALPADAHIYLVSNTLDALQRIVVEHRQQFNIPVIGITGSNAKTIVKEWIFQLLYNQLNIVRSPQSYNSQIGVPLSVWQMNSEHQLAVFEAGISMENEMSNLQPIIAPTIGLFTNIGDAHGTGFSSKKEKIIEKLILFKEVEKLVYCCDHWELHQTINQTSIPTFTWSKNANTEASLLFETLPLRNQQTQITFSFSNKTHQIVCPFTDKTNIENVLHTLALWVLLHNTHFAKLQLPDFFSPTTVPMRLSQKNGVNQCLIIDDTYSNDVSSLEIALDFQAQQNRNLPNTVVLTDIETSNKTASFVYQNILKLLIKKTINTFIGVGPQMIKHQLIFKKALNDCCFFNNTAELIAAIPQLKFKQQSILIKGARRFQLEKLVAELALHSHQTLLEVNLSALIDNLRVYRQRLKPATKIMAMVKALSYGAGAAEIATVLQHQRVDYLCVAYADEGVTLRNAGITLPIMVLNPSSASFESLIQHRLEPEIYGFTLLNQFIQFLHNKTIEHYPIHLNINTGMNRLGFEESQVKDLINVLTNSKEVKTVSIFSHLVGSESIDYHHISQAQFDQFNKISQQLLPHFQEKPLHHILNTAGIVHFPDQQLDMVRLGLGLYGLDSTQKIQNQLQLISTFKTYISQIRDVASGAGVGYNWQDKSEHTRKIATLGVGYGDGLLRKAGNGRFSVKINGQFAPTVGNVCMDMCMVDVTHISVINEGDEVLIFYDHSSIKQLSTALETITYEVLTNISERVKRVYFQE